MTIHDCVTMREAGLITLGLLAVVAYILFIVDGIHKRLRRLERVSRVLVEAHPTHIGMED